MEVGTIILIYTYYDKIITNFEVLGTISAEYHTADYFGFGIVEHIMDVWLGRCYRNCGVLYRICHKC